jgi:Family of unknown function (DUF6515)
MFKTFWIVLGLCVVMTVSSLGVFARDRDHDYDRDGRHHSARFHYREGHWYRHGWFGIDILAPALTIGAIVEALPYGYTTVTAGGVPYYRYEGVYYRHYPEGYMVVPEPAPVVVVQEQKPVTVGVVVPPQDANESVVINVPDTHGDFTPVKLIKHKGGYVGPQGEYYEHPTVKQLKVLYGK